jgi:hypothetical protein
MEFHRMLNDGFIVAHDEWLDMAVRWNGSATFELFSEVRPGAWALVETFMDFNARGGNQAYARKVALEYFDGIYNRMEQEEAANA